jgi:hypothetical protein
MTAEEGRVATAVGRRASAVAHIVRRAREVVRSSAITGPPFSPERYATRCGVIEIRRSPLADAGARVHPVSGEQAGHRRCVLTLDSRLPAHTPQWNGAMVLALAQTLLPSGADASASRELVEIGAAELLLPMHAFRPAAARTDLTMDGLRDLAVRFAAPIRLTVRQWLRTGAWRGFALLWREEAGTLRLRWRASSPESRLPRNAAYGAPADALWGRESRLYATYRTGRPHHGVEEVRAGAATAWWFTRFGVVRDDVSESSTLRAARAVLALIVL